MNSQREKFKAAFILVGACCAATMAIAVTCLCAGKTVWAAESGIKVRVFLFSGRPDPVFMLDDKSLINNVKKGLSEAKADKGFSKETVIPSMLGYKGIQISNPEKREGLPSSLAMYNGTIEVSDREERFLVDKGGALEKMLLDEAVRKGVIDEAILKRMQKD